MVVNKVELCGVNTSKLPLLREKEKEELFRRIRQGDKLAREEYIKGNLRLVLSVMKRFDSSNENADDLFQEYISTSAAGSLSDWMCGACKDRR